MFYLIKWYEQKKEERRQQRIANRVNRWMKRRENLTRGSHNEQV